jgi:hypothetical protein
MMVTSKILRSLKNNKSAQKLGLLKWQRGKEIHREGNRKRDRNRKNITNLCQLSEQSKQNNFNG